jgi:hypothetical protein
MAFMREVGSKSQKHFKGTKVLLVTDDINQRYFPFWASRTLEPLQGAVPYYLDEGLFQESNIAGTVGANELSLRGELHI